MPEESGEVREGREEEKMRCPVLPGQPYLSYSQESKKGRQNNVRRNGGRENRDRGREGALPLET